jgi:hypothetical protein
VAFATDKEALEAKIGVVVTRSVSRFEIICDWEGTSTQATEPPYDPERIYDAQSGTTFRLDGLSYGPWVDDPLQLDSYNSAHIWIPERLRYVTVLLCNLPAGMSVWLRKDISIDNTTLTYHDWLKRFSGRQNSTCDRWMMN